MAPLKNRYTESKSQKNHFQNLIWSSENNKIKFSSKKPAKSWTKKSQFFPLFRHFFLRSRPWKNGTAVGASKGREKGFFRESYENENWIREQIKTHKSSSDVKPFRVTHWNPLFGKYRESIHSIQNCSKMMKNV